ncbi:MAG: hypothetical protein EU539_02565 [Promethearchaeota archaeon]|nr:MAG: hypothetical protein EU539_02565 [Candidatus Lokiarchaeota archaeon]
MAIAKTENNQELKNPEEKISIPFTCPICKTKKELILEKSVINEAKQLTTISIPKNKICPHHFQAFVDKNFKVRGYQKVDFIFEIENQTNSIRNENTIFQDITFQGNKVEFMPKNHLLIQDKINPSLKGKKLSKMRKSKIKNKKMSLEEIYEQFWEFIDDDNLRFRELILKDRRRRIK